MAYCLSIISLRVVLWRGSASPLARHVGDIPCSVLIVRIIQPQSLMFPMSTTTARIAAPSLRTRGVIIIVFVLAIRTNVKDNLLIAIPNPSASMRSNTPQRDLVTIFVISRAGFHSVNVIAIRVELIRRQFIRQCQSSILARRTPQKRN